MSKEKQIEEITKILDSNCEGIPDTVCQENSCSSCKAKQIIGVGYRKQIKGEWVLEHETYGKMICSNCKEEAPTKTVVDRTYTRHILYDEKPFCPNCGAWMKGGAE